MVRQRLGEEGRADSGRPSRRARGRPPQGPRVLPPARPGSAPRTAVAPVSADRVVRSRRRRPRADGHRRLNAEQRPDWTRSFRVPSTGSTMNANPHRRIVSSSAGSLCALSSPMTTAAGKAESMPWYDGLGCSSASVTRSKTDDLRRICPGAAAKPRHDLGPSRECRGFPHTLIFVTKTPCTLPIADAPRLAPAPPSQ